MRYIFETTALGGELPVFEAANVIDAIASARLLFEQRELVLIPCEVADQDYADIRVVESPTDCIEDGRTIGFFYAMRPDEIPATNFDRVTQEYGRLKHIKLDQVLFLRDLIARENLSALLELGTFHGKSTAYFAAILEDLGRGKVTTLDRNACLDLEPNVRQIISSLGLSHRVDVLLHPRSFTMTLMKMFEQRPKPMFDFCYFDGAHIWDGTGFCFLLVDLMLKPGAWVVFDDMEWTLAGSVRSHPARAKHYHGHSREEMEMPQVRKVFEILVRERGYINASEPGFHWGIAQKPIQSTKLPSSRTPSPV